MSDNHNVLLETIHKLQMENAQLKAENSDLRDAVPTIKGSRMIWPSTHDNPTVLRTLLFEAWAKIEQLEKNQEAPEGAPEFAFDLTPEEELGELHRALHRKWADLRAEVLARPGALERVEALVAALRASLPPSPLPPQP